MRLSDLGLGDRGVVRGIDTKGHDDADELGHDELERRLLEIGFVEGAQFQVLQEGLIGRDPMALKLDDMRVALRRRDAEDVWVRLESR